MRIRSQQTLQPNVELNSGVKLSRISASELQTWLDRAFDTPKNTTLLELDAHTLSLMTGDGHLSAILNRTDLVLPRGRGLKLAIGYGALTCRHSLNHRDMANQLLKNLSERSAEVLLLVNTAKQGIELEKLIVDKFPDLCFRVMVYESFDSSNPEALAKEISAHLTGALITLLPSPEQERLISRLQPYLNLPLIAGLGLPLVSTLIDLQSPARASKLDGVLSRIANHLRHSILLNPRETIRYLNMLRILKLKNHELINLRPKNRLNKLLVGNPLSTALQRLFNYTKYRLWQLNCKMQNAFKRTMDLCGASVGLFLLAPLLASVILMIKVTSPGPVFYSQIRVGLRGKTFRMWKFRSMYIDADARKAELLSQNESEAGVIFKIRKDPRITPIGRIIRRLSIDELPQLYNVLIGDMSLVGPRPALESEVAQYPVLARARLEAIPGLTGLWQISGRSDLPFDKQVLLDTEYVNTVSATNDLKLIVKTIPAVLSGKGAY